MISVYRNVELDKDERFSCIGTRLSLLVNLSTAEAAKIVAEQYVELGLNIENVNERAIAIYIPTNLDRDTLTR